MKNIKLLTTICLITNIYACAVPVSNPSNSASPSPSVSTNNSSATPSPSPVSKYTYDLPLKVTNNPECSDTGISTTTYEIKEDGNYTFVSPEDPAKMQTRQLSVTEMQNLKQFLSDLNLASLAEGDKVVDPNAPQTAECRTIENFIFKVDGSEKTFDRNGRKLIHTQQYIDALNKLEYKLDELKSSNPQQKYIYTLPLTVFNQSSCNGIGSLGLLYEVTADGNFNYLTDENNLESRANRKLSSDEINEVKTLLNQADVATKAEKDVTDGVGFATVCSDVENYNLNVSGSERVFDRNGKKAVHTQEYLDSLTMIKNKLIELSRK